MNREQSAALQTAKQGTIQTGLLVVLIIAVAIIERACPPIPVPADQSQPKVEAKNEESKQVEAITPIKLEPKVEIEVIGDPAVGH
ncbi:hypothetical protein [Nannocystis punicea]|uniref:Uncharacterized protein n=1 Tax=Nannocystis punicea TaxID=2995304 RepID=A0ABY7HBM6_9BACT|nr:hypothetical protein [Nannocystis poenicansa]WAS96673.1 hypothetical protein O0S08_11025 [Nannocystis poenicansa]